ncbi:class I adenylate-forming enzyme family protein [Streptomonospora wellingtoniae]|uniref:Class I adenylate-forming enzyme family protein n=1 Tax=Streptomonospora wellingtoniae TaxID=3075544 RepID=A0ABU2KQ60_9ACTN|nr:class I adenylate-forming enzyme family protein [Streptomonospora sp. DSM 45055]MDT0301410.1 class I adenylate-forming enzyme family protein [Streptomonospora sp. DSM 45055]
MNAAWTSNNGIVLTDLVPSRLRRAWVQEGYCPDVDLYTLFRRRVRDHPHRDAVVDAEGTLDYAALDARVRGIAGALSKAGFGPGDIVAVQLSDGWRAAAAELAVAAIGGVSLPYPAMRGRAGITALLRRSRASAVIAGDATGRTDPLAELARLRPEAPHLASVFSLGAGTGPRAGAVPLDAAAADGAGCDGPGTAVPPESPARILVTSGSESEPKMIAYSHNAFAGGRTNYVAALHDGSVPMRNLVLVPLASSYGSLGVPVTLAGLGGTLIVLERFDPAAALRAAAEHRPTHLFAVPTMLRRMAARPHRPDEDTSSLRTVVTSSAVLEAGVLDATRARFGRPVLTVYGSADGMNCHTPYGTSARPGGVTGPPDPAAAEIRIVASDGLDAAPGVEGEIWARGPMSPLCYVNAPESDARYRSDDGWVRSGDRGRFEDDGALRVIDRIKRVVKRGGYSISPREVERRVAAHPAVAEAVCVPVPDEDLGERLCACVVQRAGAAPLALAELTVFLEDAVGLERVKLPEALLRLSEMPLGATGKVCHRTLAEWAASSGERASASAPGAAPPAAARHGR